MTIYDFYPRPPGGGRRCCRLRQPTQTNFYPRPPGGGRPGADSGHQCGTVRFLSTPSGWRATKCPPPSHFGMVFLSTPSGWRATDAAKDADDALEISIHALRVEGDPALFRLPISFQNFYPRPPDGGRPFPKLVPAPEYGISIHALRVEGDDGGFSATLNLEYFYPRPPGGGRRTPVSGYCIVSSFLSTPSGWRATFAFGRSSCLDLDFYPRPPGGGRLGDCAISNS